MFHSLINVLHVPLILFCLFIAPIWLVMHYRHKNQVAPASTEADRKQIEELLAMADKMESRLETLESILDKKDPNWRHEI